MAGHLQAYGFLGPLTVSWRTCLQGTEHTRPHFLFSLKQPISSFTGDFPFRSLPGRTLFFATTLCSEKRTREKYQASSWQLLLCVKASLCFQLWQIRKTPGSQKGWRGECHLSRGTHKPGIPVFAYPIPLAPPQLPSPSKKKKKKKKKRKEKKNYQHKHI